MIPKARVMAWIGVLPISAAGKKGGGRLIRWWKLGRATRTICPHRSCSATSYLSIHAAGTVCCIVLVVVLKASASLKSSMAWCGARALKYVLKYIIFWKTLTEKISTSVQKICKSRLALQRHNTENSKPIFPEKELLGLSPNFYVHLSVSDLYIPTIDLPILLQENMWTDPGNI